MSTTAQAEVTLLEGDVRGAWWQRFDLGISGSLRPSYANVMGSSDNGSYKHKGYDAESRLFIGAGYRITPATSLVGFFEPVFDIPQILHMSGHYNSDNKRVETRQRFIGFQNDTWGRLTFGQQESPYYSVVGIKTDLWMHDMLAQAPSVGVNGDYDGTFHSRKLINYQNEFGPLDVYFSGQLPAARTPAGHGDYYHRKGGGAIGLDYQLNDNIELGLAYTYTHAYLKRPGRKTNLHQHAVGTAVGYEKGPWQAAFGGGYYWDFMPTAWQTLSFDNHINKQAFGVEAYLSHTFAVDGMPVLKGIKPYFAVDRLQVTKGRHYQRTDEFLGLNLELAHGFSFILERTFTQSSDHIADENWVRLQLDF